MLAAQLGADNITVNGLAPGPFETKMMEFALNDPATRERIEQSIPLGRVGGAEDIAGVALFLCGRAAAYISGAIIPLDGGAAAARRRHRPPKHRIGPGRAAPTPLASLRRPLREPRGYGRPAPAGRLTSGAP